MKYAFYIIAVLAVASIVFNIFKLDFNHILRGDSQIAAISIIAALCVVILMSIMVVSKKINEKYGDH
jgi:antibiotic biosynthesis monooxygenase (ABM) superfamily enzyme